MRGSPLVRFALLTLALIATGMGLQRITAARAAVTAPATAIPMAAAPTMVPFRLVLSAPAAEVKIDTGVAMPTLFSDQLPLAGKLQLDPKNPHFSLVVRWKNPAATGEHRFAKLTLEAPGQETLIHVFDADGDIDDFLELPLPATP